MDEVTWQNYRGQLTEKQEKTREKVVKRMQKVNVLVLLIIRIHILLNVVVSTLLPI